MNESTESQLRRLRDRLKAAAQPYDYIIVEDIEEGYRQIDAMVLGISQ